MSAYNIAIGLLSMITYMPAQAQQPLVEVGALYRHYKGKMYKIVAIANHSETLEKYVVYQALYDTQEFGDHAIWIRPLEMFMETIVMDGQEILRFTKLNQ
jgi:hypothetical protein